MGMKSTLSFSCICIVGLSAWGCGGEGEPTATPDPSPTSSSAALEPLSHGSEILLERFAQETCVATEWLELDISGQVARHESNGDSITFDIASDDLDELIAALNAYAGSPEAAFHCADGPVSRMRYQSASGLIKSGIWVGEAPSDASLATADTILTRIIDKGVHGALAAHYTLTLGSHISGVYYDYTASRVDTKGPTLEFLDEENGEPLSSHAMTSAEVERLTELLNASALWTLDEAYGYEDCGGEPSELSLMLDGFYDHRLKWPTACTKDVPQSVQEITSYLTYLSLKYADLAQGE